MSVQPKTPGTDEPRSIEHAEKMISALQTEIVNVRNQLDDPTRRNSMDSKDYTSWRGKAMSALRYKKQQVTDLTKWCVQKRRRDHNPHVLDHVTVGMSLKLATKQYGRLVAVLFAAEAYINSSSEADDQHLWDELVMKVAAAREIIPDPAAE